MTTFLSDIVLAGANDIQFKNTAGANTGKIESDGNNLVLSNAVGDILLGDGASDVYIGDGTNSVDILFEVSGSLSAESGATLTLGGAGGALALGSALALGGNNLTGGGTITGTTLTGTSLDINGAADISGDTTITNGLHVHHDEGIEIGATTVANSYTTLTSYNSSGNSQMKIKGANYRHSVQYETSWNNFLYAQLSSSYSTSDSSFILNKSASDGSVASTTTISTGTSTFAGDVTAGSNSLTAGSLDINGNADISGNLTGVDTLTATTFSGDLNGTINTATTAATQSASNNSTKVATTAYVDAQVATVVDSAPGTLNTLNELAAALGDDASFSTTVTNSIAAKLPLAGGTMSGTTGIHMPDNFALKAGNSQDLLIYHDGSNSYIDDTGTGHLVLNTNGASMKFLFGSEFMAQFEANGSVDLYHNNVKKLETTSGGITVTGDVGATTVTASGEVQGGSLDINGAADISGVATVASQLALTANTSQIKVGTSWNTGVLQFLNGPTTAIEFDIPNGRIKNNLGKYLTSTGGNNNLFGSLDNYSMSLVTNNTARLTIDNAGAATFTGNVTAGSNSLTAGSLDINGNADISGDLTGVDTLTATTLSVTNYGLASGDIPNNAADTTGSAATLTTARTIAGVSFNGSANIALSNSYITNGAGYTGDQSQSDINALAITTVGTISSGEWRGTSINGAYIANDTINSQHYADGSIDTAHIADDQVTFAKASGVTPSVYDNIIKILPSDFVANDDAGTAKVGIAYKAVAGSSYGMKPNAADTELFALVPIPQGMSATHVDVFAKTNLGVIVYEAQIDANTMVSKGTGNCNTQINITDVDSSATNFLAIEVTTTATSDRVFGGQVTIAAI